MREAGFLLTLLLPVLLLLAAFFAGTLRVAARAQARAALQGRLDACAVRLAVSRERLLARLTKTNAAITTTVVAITAARAAMLVPGAGEGAEAAQEALLKVNEALAAAQEGMVTAAAAEEATRTACRPDRFSGELAACLEGPPAALAFERRSTPFPDVAGPLRHRSNASDLARIRCAGGRGIATELVVRGDAELRRNRFEDTYLR